MGHKVQKGLESGVLCLLLFSLTAVYCNVSRCDLEVLCKGLYGKWRQKRYEICTESSFTNGCKCAWNLPEWEIAVITAGQLSVDVITALSGALLSASGQPPAVWAAGVASARTAEAAPCQTQTVPACSSWLTSGHIWALQPRWWHFWESICEVRQKCQRERAKVGRGAKESEKPQWDHWGNKRRKRKKTNSVMGYAGTEGGRRREMQRWTAASWTQCPLSAGCLMKGLSVTCSDIKGGSKM